MTANGSNETGATEIVKASSAVHEPSETFAKDSQDYLRTFLQLADQKAAFVFTAAGALLATLFGLGAQKRFIFSPMDHPVTAALALTGMLGLFASVTFALSVVFPRESAGGAGLFYWGRIREFGAGGEYTEAVLKLTPSQLTQERLRNCRDLADVCARKYSGLRWAFGTGLVGAAASVLYVLATTSAS
jgi:hypothetical protein